MPKLIYYSTAGRWIEFSLGERTTIGRHPDQDLQLLDRMISKAHAEIYHYHGQYYLRDMGSRNGTLLNDVPIESDEVLRDGDEIGLGNHVLHFSISDSPEVLTERDLPIQDPPHEEDVSSNGLVMGLGKPIRHRMSASSFLPEREIRSEREIREDYEKLRVAAELSAEAAGVLDFGELLRLIVDKAFRVFSADRAAILLKDENGQMHTSMAVDRQGKNIVHFKISETLLEEVCVEKSAILSGDVLQDERFLSSNSLIVDNVRSTMCVPLLYSEEVLGVIYLDTQLVTGAFEEKDLVILTGFARQAALSIQQRRLISEMNQNAVIRNNLRRIISPHLIDDVMSGKRELKKSSRDTYSTVLFADIRGFSRLTEQNSPDMIVRLLNDYFENMVECIFRHDGALDKFVGDEVMALWGVNVNVENHALLATKCALDMMQAIEDMNRRSAEKNIPPIDIGIGLASGEMIAGYMGSTQAMSYTVIGDTVNLASRLCSAARAGEILLNEDAWRAVNSQLPCQSLPPVMVKGKKDPVAVYRVLRP